MTRAASRAQTHEQLLATATQLFLRDGYFATSLEAVAEEAGYSKGAVYSNFAGKDELCLAVLDRVRTERALQVARAATSGTTLEDRLRSLRAWAERVLGEQGWSVLEIEFATRVRRNPVLRQQVAQRAADFRRSLAVVIEGFAAELGVPLPLPAEELATALLSLGIGLGLQRAMDPTLGVEAFPDTLRVMFAPVRS